MTSSLLTQQQGGEKTHTGIKTVIVKYRFFFELKVGHLKKTIQDAIKVSFRLDNMSSWQRVR